VKGDGREFLPDVKKKASERVGVENEANEGTGVEIEVNGGGGGGLPLLLAWKTRRATGWLT